MDITHLNVGWRRASGFCKTMLEEHYVRRRAEDFHFGSGGGGWWPIVYTPERTIDDPPYLSRARVDDANWISH